MAATALLLGNDRLADRILRTEDSDEFVWWRASLRLAERRAQSRDERLAQMIASEVSKLFK